jgi:hypothetical protein
MTHVKIFEKSEEKEMNIHVTVVFLGTVSFQELAIRTENNVRNF